MAAARSHETRRFGPMLGADPPESQVRAQRGRSPSRTEPRTRLRRALDAELTRQGAPPVPYLELERDGELVLVALGADLDAPIVVASDRPVDADRIGRTLLTLLVDGLLGDEAIASRFSPTLSIDHLAIPTLRRFLLEAVLTEGGGGALASHTVAKLPSLPLLRVLGPDGRARQALLCDVVATHGRSVRGAPPPGAIPYVRSELPFRTLDWSPLLLTDPIEERVASVWLGVPLELADHESAVRRIRALRHARRDAVAALPRGLAADAGRFDPDRPPDRAHAPDRWIARRVVGGAGDRAIRITLGMRPADDPAIDAGIELFCDGCPLESTVLPGSDLPVLARVDLCDETLLTDSLTLRREAHRVLLHAMEDAALELASRILEEASGFECGSVLFSDAPALRLMAAVLRRSRGFPFHLALRASTLLWPTVQGDVQPFAALGTDRGRLLVGDRRYPGWIPGSSSGSKWDRPIAYAPPGPIGEATRAVLEELGLSLKSATRALATLQARRLRSHPAPALWSPPAHRLLRATLTELGADSLLGELELFEGDDREILLISHDGETRPLRCGLAFGVRAIVAPNRAATRDGPVRESAIRAAVERAALRLLDRVTKQMDDLPTFVRDARRAHLLRREHRPMVGGKAKRRSLTPEDWSVKVFLDTRGRWHSLAWLARGGASSPIRFTTSPPPYPTSRRRPSAGGVRGRAEILRLTEAEAASLSRFVALRNVTAEIVAEVAAERRASVPPAVVELSPAARDDASSLLELHDGPLRAAIGILKPGRAAERGVQILSGGRPLCRLRDEPGWPIAAVAEDNRRVLPNASFDGPRRYDRAAALLRRIRRIADDALLALLAPPDDAVVAIPVGGAASGQPFVGYLWLPARFPSTPAVEILCADRTTPLRAPLSTGGLPGLSGSLPLEGRIAVTPTRPALPALLEIMQGWAKHALETLPRALLAARRQGAPPRLIDAFRWNLALLGARDDLICPTTTGSRANAETLRSELRARGRLWYVDRQSSLAGASLRASAGLVLIDDGSPLLEVLHQRAELGMLSDSAS